MDSLFERAPRMRIHTQILSKAPAAGEALNHPCQSPFLVPPLFPDLFELESPRTQSRDSFLLSLLSFSLDPKNFHFYLNWPGSVSVACN